MKLLFICLFSLISIVSIAQEPTPLDSADLAMKKKYRDASLRMMAPHGFLTVFIDEDMNDAITMLQMFVDLKMNMTVGSGSNDFKITPTKIGSNLHMVIHDKSSYGAAPKKIIVDIVCFEINKVPYIKNIKFTGDRSRLIDLFVRYWNTRVQIRDGEGIVAERFMPTEKIQLVRTKGILSIIIKSMVE